MGLTFNTGLLSDAIKVSSTLNVGLGTSSPSTLLHLNSTSTQLTLQNTDGGGNAERVGMFMTGGDTFKLISLNDNNTTRVDNILVANVLTGNVGIGTSSPANILHAYSSLPRIISDTSTRFAVFNLYYQGAEKGAFYLDNQNKYVITEANGDNTYELLFKTANAERMRITSGGNVEIANGTLTTSAGSGTSYCARLQTIYSYPYVENYLDAVAGASYQGRFHFRTNSGNGAFTTNIRIESSGAVFLPAYGNGTMAISGGQITTSSDKNLKIDDGGIDNALFKVMNLNPRYFYWKEDSGIETKERQLGFYAQDVKEALGTEAANDNGNEKWGIYDRALIAMLTKAIQELSAKVLTLENK